MLSTICTSAKNKTVKNQKAKAPKKEIKSSEGEDDSRKLYEWEFERLKDPATGKIPGSIRERE